MDEYLPPVVTKLKADLSDFIAGITEARALMKAFAAGIKEDMLEASRSAGAMSGMTLVTEMRTVIKEQIRGFGDDVDETMQDKVVPKFAKAGADTGMGFAAGFRAFAIPFLIMTLVAAAPGIAAAIAGAIQLGFGLGFIGLGAFMLRNEPVLMAAATRLKDKIVAVYSVASAPMLGPLVKALDILTASFDRLAPSINKGFAALAPAIVPLAEGLALMMENMAPGLTALVVAAGPIIIEFAKQLPGIGTALGDLFQTIADNAPAIATFIGDAGALTARLIRGFTDVLGFLIGVYAWTQKLHTAMKDAGWETPFHGLVTSGKALWSWISSTGQKVGRWFSDLGATISDWAGKAADKIGQFVDDAGAWFTALPGRIGAAVAAIPGILGDLAVKGFDAFFYWTAFGITKILMFINQLPMNLKIIIGTMWLQLTDLWSKGVDATVATAQSLPGKIGAFFAELWITVTNWMRNTAVDAGEWMGKAVRNVLDWLVSLPGRAAEHLASFKNKAVQFFKDASVWLYQAGKDLIQGLTNGIMNAVDSAVNAIKRALDKIKRGARDALGIESPSKVFAEMGSYTMEGYIQGLQSQHNALARAMGIMGAPAPGSATAAGLAAAGTVTRGGDGASLQPLLIQLLLDGAVVVEQLIEPAQQRKIRTGQTGLS